MPEIPIFLCERLQCLSEPCRSRWNVLALSCGVPKIGQAFFPILDSSSSLLRALKGDFRSQLCAGLWEKPLGCLVPEHCCGLCFSEIWQKQDPLMAQ